MNGFFQLLLRWAVLALGVVLATKLVPGIRCDDGASLVAVVLLLSFFNAILKPLLVLFTLPFILLTLGLGVIVINALLFLFVGRLVDGFYVASFWSAVGGALIVINALVFLFVGRLVDGFYIAGFWSAVGGALIVSVTNLLLSGFVRGQARQSGTGETNPPARRPKKPDDVIDI